MRHFHITVVITKIDFYRNSQIYVRHAVCCIFSKLQKQELSRHGTEIIISQNDPKENFIFLNKRLRK